MGGNDLCGVVVGTQLGARSRGNDRDEQTHPAGTPAEEQSLRVPPGSRWTTTQRRRCSIRS